jgi:hypothetical protein
LPITAKRRPHAIGGAMQDQDNKGGGKAKPGVRTVPPRVVHPRPPPVFAPADRPPNPRTPPLRTDGGGKGIKGDTGDGGGGKGITGNRDDGGGTGIKGDKGGGKSVKGIKGYMPVPLKAGLVVLRPRPRPPPFPPGIKGDKGDGGGKGIKCIELQNADGFGEELLDGLSEDDPPEEVPPGPEAEHPEEFPPRPEEMDEDGDKNTEQDMYLGEDEEEEGMIDEEKEEEVEEEQPPPPLAPWKRAKLSDFNSRR